METNRPLPLLDILKRDIYETTRLRFMKIIRNYLISRVFMRGSTVGFPFDRTVDSIVPLSTCSVMLPCMIKLNDTLD